MKKSFLFCSLIFSILIVSSQSFADTLALININNNNTLSWKLSNIPTGNQSNVSNSFGKTGDHIVLGKFTNLNSTELGIITLNDNNKAVWKIINQSGAQIKNFSFGNKDSLFVAGADFDNNGIIDPTIIDVSRRRMSWTIRMNGSSENQNTLRINHGRKRHFKSGLYLNLYGDGDWLGYVIRKRGGNSTLKLRNLFTREVRSINLGNLSLDTKRPLPIANSNLLDIIAIPESADDQTKVTFLDSQGNVLGTKTFNSTDTIVVGEFNVNQAGEEIAIQKENKLITYNPFTNISKTITVSNAILVDSININYFSSNSNGGGYGGTCPGGTPGICGCRFLDENDGYKTGFVYKRKSETYGGIVMVLANPCGRQTTGMVTLDTNCNEIHRLTYTGLHNPDPSGLRAHYKEVDARYDGNWYRSNYGSIILRMEGAGTCYMIENPAEERID
jgi:hypothetical protein